jgi:hypothetical protein
MPEADGKLTPEDKKKIQDWLTGHGWTHRGGCPICGDTKWTILDYVVQPITLGGNNAINLGGPGYPQVMILSNKCGYTVFLNAVVMGLLKDDRKKNG